MTFADNYDKGIIIINNKLFINCYKNIYHIYYYFIISVLKICY